MAEENRGAKPGKWEGNGRKSSRSGSGSTEEARRAIEQTRGRISTTLDAIEDRLGAKKERLKERADVLGPVRHRVRMHVWPSLGVAFVTGLLLAGFGRGNRVEGRWLGKAERRERRQWRAERRLRLHAAQAEGTVAKAEPTHAAASRAEKEGERSPLDDFGRTIARAIGEGLKERARAR